ncbi:MAG TPA: FMN-binding protein [Humibacter sp.]|nr:FMN-binding protein [Humibacter sp.]
MRPKKWRGTVLFAGVLATMALTVGMRWYAEPASTATSAVGGTSSTGAADADATTSTPTGASAAPSASSTPTPTTKASATKAPAATTKTVNGATEQTPYGPIQVAVTFSGTRIVKVAELQAPSGGRSDEINSQAAPLLAREVLASQSARIDTVSGATYTSEGYTQSVQSAIDNR